MRFDLEQDVKQKYILLVNVYTYVIILIKKSLAEVVKITKGYSGADMRNLCSEAALIPIRSCTNIKAMSM